MCRKFIWSINSRVNLTIKSEPVLTGINVYNLQRYQPKGNTKKQKIGRKWRNWLLFLHINGMLSTELHKGITDNWIDTPMKYYLTVWKFLIQLRSYFTRIEANWEKFFDIYAFHKCLIKTQHEKGIKFWLM